jgi:MFS family permease
MSFTVPDQPPPRQRPTVVTVSSSLLFLIAALYALALTILVPQLGAMSDAYERVYAGTELEDSAGFGVIGAVGVSVFMLALAAGLAVLGIFNNRGKNPSRITTWAIGGVLLCCSGIGLAAQGLLSGIEVESGTGPTPEEVEAAVEDALPSWYSTFQTLSTVIVLLSLVAALILLMLPAANEFFRKPPEIFEPPQYPPAPGGPQYPPPQDPPAPGGPPPPPPGPTG